SPAVHVEPTARSDSFPHGAVRRPVRFPAEQEVTTPAAHDASISLTEDDPGALAPAASAQRPLTGWLRTVARAAGIALPILTLWCAFSGWWDAMVRAAGHLMMTVPLVFLYYSGGRRTAKVTAWDLTLAAISLVAFGWIVVSQERLMWRLVYVDPLSWA